MIEDSRKMNPKKSTQKYQHVGIMKKMIQKHSGFTDKKFSLSSYSKYCREPLKWYCEDCALMLTSELQAREHFFGKKHQNVMRSKGDCIQDLSTHIRMSQCSPTKKNLISCDKLQDSGKSSLGHYWGSKYGVYNFPDVIPPPGRDNILETVIKSEKRSFYSSDLSIYRTPSGKYYCQPCNLTVNSQAQFLQHSESRKHKHKASRSSFKIK